MDTIEKLLRQGFTFRSFPAYPRHLGVEKYTCAALLERTAEGEWRQFSSAGALLEEGEIALLVERLGRSVFVYKSRELPAEGERLENYRRFMEELRSALGQP
jgi:hypothetical protein